MKTRTILYVAGALLGIMLLSAVIGNLRGDAPAVPAGPVEAQDQGPLKCGDEEAYALTQKWVKWSLDDTTMAFPSFDQRYVSHGGSEDLFQVKGWYIMDGNKMPFYATMFCMGDRWKTVGLKVNGQHFPGGNDYVEL